MWLQIVNGTSDGQIFVFPTVLGRGRFGPSHIPPMDDVVVCSGLGITENYRGIVIGLEKGLYSKVIVVVRNIESGFVSRVTLDDICTPNEAIMSVGLINSVPNF